jgi:hypothetical protein
LRDQLNARGLDSKGVKNILAQRLQEALDAEKAKEESEKTDSTEVKPELKNDDIIVIDEVKAVEEINPDDLVVKDDIDEKMDTSDAQNADKTVYLKRSM